MLEKLGSSRVTRTPHIDSSQKEPKLVMQAVLLEAVQGRHAALAEERVYLSFGCGQSKGLSLLGWKARGCLEDHMDIEFI